MSGYYSGISGEYGLKTNSIDKNFILHWQSIRYKVLFFLRQSLTILPFENPAEVIHADIFSEVMLKILQS